MTPYLLSYTVFVGLNAWVVHPNYNKRLWRLCLLGPLLLLAMFCLEIAAVIEERRGKGDEEAVSTTASSTDEVAKSLADG